MMSEIWGPPVIFSILMYNRNISLRRTNKHINNKVTWIYSTNDFQYILIVVLKIWYCHYITITWYSGKLPRFDENGIILWLRPISSSSRYNIMTKITIVIETKKYTTSNKYFYWIDNTSILHNTVSVLMAMWCRFENNKYKKLVYSGCLWKATDNIGKKYVSQQWYWVRKF